MYKMMGNNGPALYLDGRPLENSCAIGMCLDMDAV